MFLTSPEKIENWIYVTGVPRSGTTFVGLNLSLYKEVDYIHEPFNPMCGMPGINDWYRYYRVGSQDPQSVHFQEMLVNLFQYNFSLKNNIPKNDPFTRRLVKKIVGSRGAFNLRLAKLNPFHKAAIIKDPIGCFLTEYLYCNFNVKPIVIVKHPISFVASLRRVGFKPGRKKLCDQKELIEDYFSDEPDYLSQYFDDPILEAAAFWRVVYKVLLLQSQKYKDWKIITHEELSASPVEIFQDLYHFCDLPWGKKVEIKIMKQTQSRVSSDARNGRVQDFTRNSAGIFEARRSSLALEERRAIFEIVKDVALDVYSEESFMLSDRSN